MSFWNNAALDLSRLSGCRFCEEILPYSRKINQERVDAFGGIAERLSCFDFTRCSCGAIRVDSMEAVDIMEGLDLVL